MREAPLKLVVQPKKSLSVKLSKSIPTHLLASERGVCTRNVLTGIFG